MCSFHRLLAVPLLSVVFVLYGCQRESAEPRGNAREKPPSPSSPTAPAEPDNPASPEVAVELPENAHSEPDAEPAPDPLPVYRPRDRRPRHDEAKLARMGIRAYESKRLKLYTDIAPEKARRLPALMDQAYDAWVKYFGSLPPDPDGAEFQISGYVIGDMERFTRADLVPEDLPKFNHGRHRGYEFWMKDQPTDYYRRHLMIHEGTHCFMAHMADVGAPNWYLEGMAELFATHTLDADGTASFRVLPSQIDDFKGLGRITMIETECAETGPRSLDSVLHIRSEEFLDDHAYAWSWALCKFLDTHPRYRKRFPELGDYVAGSGFTEAFWERYRESFDEMETEWMLFAANLRHGYDIERSAMTFPDASPLGAEPVECEIEASGGWQPARVRLVKGQRITISAKGRFTLANDPKPWISEPQGISFQYHAGRPVGMLVAAVRSSDPDADGETMLEVLPIGRQATITAPVSGTLYLRLNDFWHRLGDNRGAVSVTVESE